MTFVFWQNIISIHQKAFLEALVKQPGVNKVLLVVEHELSPVRKDMGWDVPELRGVAIMVSPSIAGIKQVVADNMDAVHTMGGIRIGSMITAAFDECVLQKCSIGIMTEPYDNTGLKGRLRTLKYSYYKRKYFKHIQFVLAIGRQGVAQYSALGYNARRLFPWAYFISIDAAPAVPAPGITRIIYAGRLEEAKGIYRFVAELAASLNRNFRLDIYGLGADEEQLKTLIAEKGLDANISLTRYLKYEELLAKYKAYDWVVLPSTQKDGWGVIVSEGLLNGLKAIVSSKCGVSWVIKDGFNGVTFDWNEDGSCRWAIDRMLSGSEFAAPHEISKWAQGTISGEAGAAYFMRIMACVYHNQEKPAIPWD